jgi:hypothetical protein
MAVSQRNSSQPRPYIRQRSLGAAVTRAVMCQFYSSTYGNEFSQNYNLRGAFSRGIFGIANRHKLLIVNILRRFSRTLFRPHLSLRQGRPYYVIFVTNQSRGDIVKIFSKSD